MRVPTAPLRRSCTFPRKPFRNPSTTWSTSSTSCCSSRQGAVCAPPPAARRCSIAPPRSSREWTISGASAASVSGASRLRVAVASSPLRGSVMLERDFCDFRRRCPRVALDVSFLSSVSCLSELRSKAVDAAVVPGRPGSEGLVSERVGSVELRLLVSRGHALASRKALALGALLAEPYDSRWLKATVLELLSRHGVRPRMASLEMSAARHHGFLHEDGGAVLVICDGRYPEQFPDVEAVPFAEGEGMELPTYLAWRREAPAARMAALAECLRDSR